MKIEIALEWFKNPDHLPFIAAIEQGWFAEAGLDVSLREPDAHYDGLAAAIRGEVAFACNEPLHMIDEHRPGLKALGCFFETDGGILLLSEAKQKLLRGEQVRLASPVAGEITDDIAVEILRRWTLEQGAAFSDNQVSIEEAGFEHLNNLQAGFDGAWLCFYNFEGVEARYQGLDTLFISSNDVGMQNFSALELFTSEDFLRRHPQTVEVFGQVLSRSAAACSADTALARKLWYQHTGETPSPVMDAIIDDTCTRLVTPFQRDPQRWFGMWQQFTDLGLSQIDEAGYWALYDLEKANG